MKKHRKQSKIFLHTIQQTINTFSSLVDKSKLCNVSIGQATILETANCLYITVSGGILLRDQFITECNLNSDIFHEPLGKSQALLSEYFQRNAMQSKIFCNVSAISSKKSSYFI